MSPDPEAMGQALPAGIAALIERVVRATRLRRAERDDVRRELASHFAEALAAGTAPAAAIAAYGDAKASARALRAAAIAKRSPIDRALGQMFRFAALGVGTVAAVYVLFGLYLAANGPRVSFDPLARLADVLPKPARAEDVAWPRYREILPRLGLTEHADDANVATDRIDGGAGWPGRAPADEQGATWDEQRAWCDAHAADLAALRVATKLPVLGMPITEPLSEADRAVFSESTVANSRQFFADTQQPFRAFGVLCPHLASIRQAARILALDATVAASRGQGSAAVDDLAAIIALSVQVQQPRFLICDLVAMAMRSVACSRATILLESMPEAFTDADLVRLQQSLRSVPKALTEMDLQSERIGFEDAVQWMYTDDGHGGGWFNPSAANLMMLGGFGDGSVNGSRDDAVATSMLVLTGPAAAMWVADRRELMEFYDAWSDELLARKAWTLRELHDAPPTQTDIPLRSGDWVVTSRYLIAALLMPALERVNWSFAADRAQREAVDTAAACVRFKLAHGAWPARTADLVPAFLASVPKDPWSGQPVQMKGEGSEFRVWSVGDDQIDHDGAIARDGKALSATTLPRAPRDRSGEPVPCDWVWFAPSGSIDRWFAE